MVNLNRKQNAYGTKSIKITTTITPELKTEAEKYNIVIAEALRRGLTAILAERNAQTFMNPLQAQRKIEELAQKLQDFAQKAYEYEEELNKIRGQK